MKKEKDKEWDERWKTAWSDASDATKEFHKDFDATILAISTGAIAFTSYITKDNQTWMLKAAIIAWGVTAFFLILSQAAACLVQAWQLHWRIPRGDISNAWWGNYIMWGLNLILFIVPLFSIVFTVIGLLQLNPPPI